MRDVVIGTAGHVDHGKSALVRALTGTDPDRLQEEKARGITIDLGFAHYRQDDTTFAFVDVPGHERFVRKMIAGASGIDAVLLVGAADESVMPQTREHFDICRLLSVDRGVVALSKCDLVDAEMLELVRLETEDLLGGSGLENAPVIPVSAKTGAGLETLRDALAAVAAAPPRAAEGPVRLPVDRAFTVRGVGTVVTGTLVSGEIRADMELEVLPAGRRVRVRGVQVHGRSREAAGAGRRVAVNLHGMDADELRRGDAVVTRDGFDTTRRFDASVTLLADAPALRHGARVRCHHGTAEAMARISLSAPTRNADDEDNPVLLSVLEPGAGAFARVRVETPLALTRGDRFVLRAYSPPVTIAGGQVLDPLPPRGRFRSPRGVARLRRLGGEGGTAAGLLVMVDEGGGRGAPRESLTRRLGVTAAWLDQAAAELESEGRVVAVGGLLVAPADLRVVRGEVLGLITEFHARQPLAPGLPREEARERLSRHAAPAVIDHAVAGLVADGKIVATDHLALAEHRIVLSADEARVRDRLADTYQAAGLAPPDVGQAAAAAGAQAALAERMQELLVRDGTLVRVEGLVFHKEHLDRLAAEVGRLKSATTEPVRIDIGMFKERFGVSRKYALPLLGYLDRMRVTRRVGNARLVL
ncbi:MAG: selenocysteine-specific translation elongation factor [Acidobacteria bacterium]|nr:selenocysteine-specific translation elongation factor [Acidobacteriota bacterium]